MNYKCLNCSNFCDEIFETCDRMENKEDIIKGIYEGLDKLIKLQSNPKESVNNQTIINYIKDLPYRDKSYIFKMCFGLPVFNSGKIDDKLGLISILASVLYSQKKKSEHPGEITGLDIIIKVTGKSYADLIANTPLSAQDIDSLACYIEEFESGILEPNFGGLTSAADMRSTVNQILLDTLPF